MLKLKAQSKQSFCDFETKFLYMNDFALRFVIDYLFTLYLKNNAPANHR